MTELTITLVDAIGDAFNANDIDAVMPHFHEDAVFDHAIGAAEHGVRFSGKDALRTVFGGLFDKVENVHWQTLDARIAGDKAFCEYRRSARFKDGTEETCLSVDILTFRDGLIIHKDTYYKQRTD
ncbi:MAG: nuclear transport factor 2 family protein [Gammaproteobacteria bacterium]|jgi:ketosteroid isomerase-like protein|nr:nuclear transport factor 2 family protein [Gammaproteobacteria bacterium]